MMMVVVVLMRGGSSSSGGSGGVNKSGSDGVSSGKSGKQCLSPPIKKKYSSCRATLVQILIFRMANNER